MSAITQCWAAFWRKKRRQVHVGSRIGIACAVWKVENDSVTPATSQGSFFLIHFTKKEIFPICSPFWNSNGYEHQNFKLFEISVKQNTNHSSSYLEKVLTYASLLVLIALAVGFSPSLLRSPFIGLTCNLATVCVCKLVIWQPDSNLFSALFRAIFSRSQDKLQRKEKQHQQNHRFPCDTQSLFRPRPRLSIRLIFNGDFRYTFSYCTARGGAR